MGRMISVRVGDRTHREVARLARASGRTESAVVREAIEFRAMLEGRRSARAMARR